MPSRAASGLKLAAALLRPGELNLLTKSGRQTKYSFACQLCRGRVRAHQMQNHRKPLTLVERVWEDTAFAPGIQQMRRTASLKNGRSEACHEPKLLSAKEHAVHAPVITGKTSSKTL